MRVNEKIAPWTEDLTLEGLRQRYKPDADLILLNGISIDPALWAETALHERDEVILIRRGESPRDEELLIYLEARHSPRLVARFQKACVGIAGVGGLGSHVAHALARSGVGRLVIADCDVVEPSNLHRQAYRIFQIGYRKVEALASDLMGIQPSLRVEAHFIRLTPENIPTLFRDCDVVVECLDRPEEKAMLVETIRQTFPHLPLIAASGIAGIGEGNAIQTRRIGPCFWVVGDGISEVREGESLFSTRVLIAAGQQAHLVLRILAGEEGMLSCPSPSAERIGNEEEEKPLHP